MKRIASVASAFLLLVRTADAGELHPPQGFEYAEVKMSPQGSFKLVHYIKPPGDFTCESQIWLEPLKPEFKRQRLFTFTNRAYPVMDATETHIAIAHHEDSADNFLWVFVRGADGLFRRLPHELRAAALKEFSRQTGIHKTREDFDHFDCYPDEWLDHGRIRGYLRGDSREKGFYLKPWYFVYDADHEKFVPHDFPENKDAFVREQR